MKLKIVKRFPLDYLGEEWKECYINFKPFSVSDVRNKLPIIAKLQTDNADEEAVNTSVDTLLDLLKEKFIDGKVLEESGQIVNLTQEDLKDLPVELLGRAFSFLSQIEPQNS